MAGFGGEMSAMRAFDSHCPVMCASFEGGQRYIRTRGYLASSPCLLRQWMVLARMPVHAVHQARIAHHFGASAVDAPHPRGHVFTFLLNVRNVAHLSMPHTTEDAGRADSSCYATSDSRYGQTRTAR